MNKKIFRYSLMILIILTLINIATISATDPDSDSNILSDQILADDAGVDEVLPDNTNPSSENDGETNDNTGGNTGDATSGTSTDTAQTNDEPASDNSADKTSSEKIIAEKTYLSSANYAIKSKYFNVYLKTSKGKAIANKQVKLTINGRTLSATTNSAGMAKFYINNLAKTYSVNLKFNGDSNYEPSAKTFNLKVIANPIYTKLIIAETGIIKNDYLKVYLKTTKGKAIAKQTIKITINGKTYTRTTNKNGLVKLKLSQNAKIYDLTVNYAGKGNYVPVSKKTKINILNCKLLGKTSYGKVYFIGVIGNRSSKVKIAYVVGLHSMENKIHDSVYTLMKNKINMKYKYYIYRITLTNKKGSYSTLRMRGQKLAKKYIVPHAKKQNYDLVVDIHSTSGISYKQTYFIHVPKNQHEPSMKLAKKTIQTIKSIEKNSKMLYWSPPTQTSPPYIHLPLIKAGTPTFVFETWTYEKKSQTNKRAKILTTAIDKIFG